MLRVIAPLGCAQETGQGDFDIGTYYTNSKLTKDPIINHLLLGQEQTGFVFDSFTYIGDSYVMTSGAPKEHCALARVIPLRLIDVIDCCRITLIPTHQAGMWDLEEMKPVAPNSSDRPWAMRHDSRLHTKRSQIATAGMMSFNLLRCNFRLSPPPCMILASLSTEKPRFTLLFSS